MKYGSQYYQQCDCTSVTLEIDRLLRSLVHVEQWINELFIVLLFYDICKRVHDKLKAELILSNLQQTKREQDVLMVR